MKTTRFKFRDNGGNSFIVYALNRSQAYAEAKKKSLCSVLYFVD